MNIQSQDERNNKSALWQYDFLENLAVYDRRYLPRWQITNKAFYRIGKEPLIFKTQIRNLNMKGTCLFAHAGLRLHQHLNLRICLSNYKSFEVQGIVMWKKDHIDFMEAGIIFDKLDCLTQDLILEYAFTADRGSYNEGNLN